MYVLSWSSLCFLFCSVITVFALSHAMLLYNVGTATAKYLLPRQFKMAGLFYALTLEMHSLLTFGSDARTFFCCAFALCIHFWEYTPRNTRGNELFEAMAVHVCVVAREGRTTTSIIAGVVKCLKMFCQVEWQWSGGTSFLSNPWTASCELVSTNVACKVHARCSSSNFPMLFCRLSNSLTCGSIQNAPTSESNERNLLVVLFSALVVKNKSARFSMYSLMLLCWFYCKH